MIHKRSFIDDCACEESRKQPRNWDNNSKHFAPVATNCADHTTYASGDEVFGNDQVGRRYVDDCLTELPNGITKAFDTNLSSCFSNFWWADRNVIEADSGPEAAVHFSFFPEYFAPADKQKALVQPEDTYLSHLDSPSPNLVSIGPDHQADIPEWGGQSFNRSHPNHALSMNSAIVTKDKNEERLMGTCIIPMPGFETLATHSSVSFGNRVDCECVDNGSVECIREHVMEARESLRRNLGQEVFDALGFGDTGEDVAKKWTEDEEQTFHSVVHSNSATLGKNFWHHLMKVFPARTKKDLVSYYFNVFMLQKRAEQNCFDPQNIDSDNDEWERTEDGMIEEDEEQSVVESLSSKGTPACFQEEDQTEDFCGGIEGDVYIVAHENVADASVRRVTANSEYEGDVDDNWGERIEKVLGDSSGDDCEYYKRFNSIENNSGDNSDFQDDSCTSYDYQGDNADFCITPCNSKLSSEE